MDELIIKDEEFMRMALAEAKLAEDEDEVPVGAIAVKDGKVIAVAHNTRESDKCATHHAELMAIEKSCEALGGWRLPGVTLYVTMEPCCLCAGAIINARLKKVYFGGYDKNYGCAGSKYNFLQDKTFEHLVDVEGGILEQECSTLIKNFFIEIRKRNKNVKELLKQKSKSKN